MGPGGTQDPRGYRGPQEEGVIDLVAMEEHLLTIHARDLILPHAILRWGAIISPLLQMRKLSPRGMKDPPEVPQLGGGGAREVTVHTRQ